MIPINKTIAAVSWSFLGWLVFGGIAFVQPTTGFFAQTLAAQDPQSQQVEDEILATVADHPIMLSRVQRHAQRTIGERKLSPEQLKTLQQASLNHLVNREIVNHFLELRKFDVGENQIRFEVDLLIANLETVGQTLDDFLAKDNRTRDDFEHEIRWKLRWKQYLEKHLTEKVQRDYFDRNRRKFDGTEMEVAQILFAIKDPSEAPDSIAASIASAVQIREQLTAGEVTWRAAVEANSIAQSKNNEGNAGWIRYSEPMPLQFSLTAFGLEAGQIAEPFASKFGVHLIKCLQVKPGTAEFGDVKDEVKTAATKDLFERIANRHQTEVSIDYASDWHPRQR